MRIPGREEGAGRDEISSVMGQLRISNVVIFFIFILLLFSDLMRMITGQLEYGIYFISGDILWVLVCGINISRLYCERKGILKRVIAQVKCHIPFGVMLTAALILAIEPGQLQFRWDGELYRQACKAMDIHSLSSLGAYGHLSQAYGSLYYLIYIVLNNTELSMAAMNILLFGGSILGYYLLLTYWMKDNHKLICLLGTAIYAFSPFLLGMVNYYSLDYMTLCMFVWVICFAVRGKWILHFIAALLFIFTKEPAIVIYGAFCLGTVLKDWRKDKGYRLAIRLKRLFRRYQYYLMILSGSLWVITYVLIGGWSGGDGGFELSLSYMGNKLKVLYLLNFNWLMVIVVLLGILVSILRRKRGRINSEVWIPLLCSLMAFTLFSLFFRTVNHTRYSAVCPVILYLLAFDTVASFIRNPENVLSLRKKRKSEAGAMGVMALLMLVSSYRTVDPVSLFCFERIPTGKQEMITTGASSIGDSMIYNKQMLREENVMRQAIGYAVNKGYQIWIPMYSDSLYFFDGLMTEGVRKEGYFQTTQYWDPVKKCRIPCEGEGTIPFEMYEIISGGLPIVESVEDGLNPCYIYSPLLGAETAERLQEIYGLSLKTLEFQSEGWVLYMMIF